MEIVAQLRQEIESPPADSPLAAIPPVLRLALAPWLPVLVLWLSQWVYRGMVLLQARDPLVRLAAVYDPAAVVARCAGFYRSSGRGCPRRYSIAILVRCEIVRAAMGGCGDPELERMLARDMVLRWFVGLPLFGPTPDHSTLNRFHHYMLAHCPDAWHLDVLAFLDEVDPEDPRQVAQILDTFALRTCAQTGNGLVILLRLLLRLRKLGQILLPVAAQAALPDLDPKQLAKARRQHTAEEMQPYWQYAVERGQQALRDLSPLLMSLPDDSRQGLSRLLLLVRKVITDETYVDANGRVQERADKDKGTFRLATYFDPDATHRKHGRNRSEAGYNAAVLASSSRIYAADVRTGSTPDDELVVPLLQQEQQAGQTLPAYVVMDRAGGRGKTRAAVQRATDGQTMMVAHTPRAGGADSTRFGPGDFTLSADGLSCTCPNDVTSTRRYDSAAGEGHNFRFTAKDCHDCPLWNRCRIQEADSKAPRSVYKTPYDSHLQQAAAFCEASFRAMPPPKANNSWLTAIRLSRSWPG